MALRLSFLFSLWMSGKWMIPGRISYSSYKRCLLCPQLPSEYIQLLAVLVYVLPPTSALYRTHS
jgi:hypothetical protein